MSIERVTERTDGVTTERVVEREPSTATVVERRGGGFGAGLLAVVLLLLVAVVGVFLFTRSQSETARDGAVAGAAAQVGDAAQNVGEAVGNAADRVAPAN